MDNLLEQTGTMPPDVAELLKTSVPVTLTSSPTNSPTRASTGVPATIPPALKKTPCANDCSTRGDCDYATGTCTCFGGYNLVDCSQFVLEAGILGNTSELGHQGPRGLLTISALVRPADFVSCQISAYSAEASLAVSEIVLSPGTMNVVVNVTGVKDYDDDGAQRFWAAVGPCRSEQDRRFSFSESFKLAYGWNEHVEFPHIVKVVPTASSMVGQQMTINGNNFYEESRVYVDSRLISGPPEYRVVLLNNKRGSKSEIELTNDPGRIWLQSISPGVTVSRRLLAAPSRPTRRARPGGGGGGIGGGGGTVSGGVTAGDGGTGGGAVLQSGTLGAGGAGSLGSMNQSLAVTLRDGSIDINGLTFTYTTLRILPLDPLLTEVEVNRCLD